MEMMINYPALKVKTNKQIVYKTGKTLKPQTHPYLYLVEGNPTNQQPLVQKQYNLCGFI